MLNFESNGNAYILDADNKKCSVKNVEMGLNGKITVYRTAIKHNKVAVPHNMTWIRTTDLLDDGKTIKLNDDPQIVSLAGNLVHDRGIQAHDEETDEPLSVAARGCWLNLESVQLKRRENTEVKWGN